MAIRSKDSLHSVGQMVTKQSFLVETPDMCQVARGRTVHQKLTTDIYSKDSPHSVGPMGIKHTFRVISPATYPISQRRKAHRKLNTDIYSKGSPLLVGQMGTKQSFLTKSPVMYLMSRRRKTVQKLNTDSRSKYYSPHLVGQMAIMKFNIVENPDTCEIRLLLVLVHTICGTRPSQSVEPDVEAGKKNTLSQFFFAWHIQPMYCV